MNSSHASAPPAIETIVESAIYADDLDRLESFYSNLLGLPVLGREKGRHVFFRVGTGSVLLAFKPDSTLKGDVLPAHGARGPGHDDGRGLLLSEWPRKRAHPGGDPRGDGPRHPPGDGPDVPGRRMGRRRDAGDR